MYGTDQIEARYILTNSLMKRITDFKKKTNEKIHISFSDNKIFVAIPKSLFVPKISESVLNFRFIEEYYSKIRFVIGITEQLNLNSGIWEKI